MKCSEFRFKSVWLVLGVPVLWACATRAVPDDGAPTDTRTAAAIFAEMESRLLEASAITGRYTVAAEGAFSASLHGTLTISRATDIDLEATGTFGDDSVALSLRSDGGTMEGGNSARRFHEDAPAGLTEALLLGLTRMGILHNLARLTGGATPDRAGGGVREWVEVRDVHVVPAATREELASGLVVMRFVLYVSETRAAEATLWMDAATGLPVRREQVVSFPGGQMVVNERYDLSVDRD